MAPLQSRVLHAARGLCERSGLELEQLSAPARERLVHDVAKQTGTATAEVRRALLDAGIQRVEGLRSEGPAPSLGATSGVRSPGTKGGLLSGGRMAELFARGCGPEPAALDPAPLLAAGHRVEATTRRNLPALRLLPDRNGSPLNKIAAEVEAKWNMTVVYAPALLATMGARGAFVDENTVVLDEASVRDGKPSATALHELTHGYKQHRRNQGRGDTFDPSLDATYSRFGISDQSDVYRDYQSAEELVTFAKGCRQTVPAAPDTDPVPLFPDALLENVRRTDMLARQTGEALDGVLDKLKPALAARSPSELEAALDATQLTRAWGKGPKEVKLRGERAQVSLPQVTEADRQEAAQQAETKRAVEGFGFLRRLLSPKAFAAARRRGFEAEQAVLASSERKLSRLRDAAEQLQGLAQPLRAELEGYQDLARAAQSHLYDDGDLRELASKQGIEMPAELGGEALRAALRPAINGLYTPLFASLKDRTSRIALLPARLAPLLSPPD